MQDLGQALPLEVGDLREAGAPLDPLEAVLDFKDGRLVLFTKRQSAWLIGHAPEFGISEVSFAGQIWTASSGRWVAYSGPIDMTVRVTEER